MDSLGNLTNEPINGSFIERRPLPVLTILLLHRTTKYPFPPASKPPSCKNPQADPQSIYQNHGKRAPRSEQSVVDAGWYPRECFERDERNAVRRSSDSEIADTRETCGQMAPGSWKISGPRAAHPLSSPHPCILIYSVNSPRLDFALLLSSRSQTARSQPVHRRLAYTSLSGRGKQSIVYRIRWWQMPRA